MSKKKTDLGNVVKKAEADKIAGETKAVKDAKSLKSDIPPLKEYSVEPVVKPKDKGKKPKGAARNAKKKHRKNQGGKTNAGTIKKSEKKTDAGKEAPVPVPGRRKRGFFDWFTDGGKDGGEGS